MERWVRGDVEGGGGRGGGERWGMGRGTYTSEVAWHSRKQSKMRQKALEEKEGSKMQDNVPCNNYLGVASSICATSCVPLTVGAATKQGCICIGGVYGWGVLIDTWNIYQSLQSSSTSTSCQISLVTAKTKVFYGLVLQTGCCNWYSNRPLLLVTPLVTSDGNISNFKQPQ